MHRTDTWYGLFDEPYGAGIKRLPISDEEKIGEEEWHEQRDLTRWMVQRNIDARAASVATSEYNKICSI